MCHGEVQSADLNAAIEWRETRLPELEGYIQMKMIGTMGMNPHCFWELESYNYTN